MSATSRGPKNGGTPAYRQCWRVVEGAVRSALDAHPEYLSSKGQRQARDAITKRVTGALIGYAEQSAQGRSGSSPAVATGEGAAFTLDPSRPQVGSDGTSGARTLR